MIPCKQILSRSSSNGYQYGAKLRPEPLNLRINPKLLSASFEIGATDPVGGDQTGGVRAVWHFMQTWFTSRCQC